MKHRVAPLIALILITIPVLLIPQQPVRAATLTAGSALELIGAISTANGLPGADTIIVTNDITLTTVIDTGFGNSSLPVITSDITIEGQGHTITRGVGAPNFRILRVAAGNLTLHNLVVSNGSQTGGGGLYNNGGTVTITNSTFSGNSSSGSSGGGVYSNGGTVTITNSTFSGNSADFGGGVYNNTGTVTITNSTFSGNSAANSGGGMGNNGTLTITNSTLSSNTASTYGGGVRHSGGLLTITNSIFSGNSTPGQGGGILNTGPLTITNSTFSGNSAANEGGGLWVNLSSATVTNSTFFGNSATSGGGLYNNGGLLTIINSIIANSLSGANCTGTISGSFSLADDATCGGFTNSPNINLVSLTDNGGSTHTIALNPGSSALDAANSTNCTSAPVNGVDQRGVPRGLDANGTANNPQTGDCDIGAFKSGGTIRTMQFAGSSTTFTPGGVSTLNIPISLDAPLGIGYGFITAYIWVSGGTTLAGTNYAPFGVQTVTFNPGDQSKAVTLNVPGSSLTADRTIILSFANSSGPGFSGPAQLGTLTSHTVTLKASAPAAAPTASYYGTRDITLTWNDISWATGYEIQVDTDSTFSAPYVAEDTSLAASTTSYEVTVPDNGTYYWRVRAKLPNGTPAPTYSPVQMFVVAGT